MQARFVIANEARFDGQWTAGLRHCSLGRTDRLLDAVVLHAAPPNRDSGSQSQKDIFNADLNRLWTAAAAVRCGVPRPVSQ
jgi:hypothetical protein